VLFHKGFVRLYFLAWGEAGPKKDQHFDMIAVVFPRSASMTPVVGKAKTPFAATAGKGKLKSHERQTRQIAFSYADCAGDSAVLRACAQRRISVSKRPHHAGK
jgi:hypothetical protein